MTRETKIELQGIGFMIVLALFALWLTSCATTEELREVRRDIKVMNGRIRQLERDETFSAPIDEPAVEIEEAH